MRILFLALVVLVMPGCTGETCRGVNDCSFGYYCVLDRNASRVSGHCEQDCIQNSDCPSAALAAERAICDNDGRCRNVQRVPKLRLRTPEPGTVLDAAQRSLEITGEVETAASRVRVEVRAVGSEACPGGAPVLLELGNEADAFRELPFLVDDLAIDPFTREVEVQVSSGTATRRRTVALVPSCEDCGLGIQAPARAEETRIRRLPWLVGQARPEDGLVGWRVRGGRGGLFEGVGAPDPTSGGFRFPDLPLFAGSNQLEVVVWRPEGELRCTSYVRAPGVERGLRVVLTWDDPDSDLDLHLVGPGGRFGMLGQDLSPATGPALGGTFLDDFDGLGPEWLEVPVLADGVYGVLVEPHSGSGSAMVRIFQDGAPLDVLPAGPRFLDTDRADLWVVATLEVSRGTASLRALDERLDRDAAPTTAPSLWPAFQ